jgi:fatty acid desaturase
MESEAVAVPGPRRRSYGPSWYLLDKATLAELHRLQPYRPILAALAAWIFIFAVAKIYLSLDAAYLLYPVAAFLIASRAGVFLQLAHEAAHGLISHGRFNDWFGKWVASYPLGLDLPGYKATHLQHHVCTNTPCDPASDVEKYRVADIRDPHLGLLFLKDITGVTALSIRLMYERGPSRDPVKEELGAGTRFSRESLRQKLKKYGSIALVQSLILLLVFDLNPFHYFALWLLPLMTAHMVLMRIRGIAEHGLGIQLGVKNLEEMKRGLFYTRSFGAPLNAYRFAPLTWAERLLIGSLNVYYHHEHHLFPRVPYYNLPKLHNLIGQKIRRNNPFVYSPGYLSSLFFNLKERGPVPTLG